MAELRIHDFGIDLVVQPRELRIHDFGIIIDEVPPVKELRIHEFGITFGVPPSGPGGVYFGVDGEWVEHEELVAKDGQWE